MSLRLVHHIMSNWHAKHSTWTTYIVDIQYLVIVPRLKDDVQDVLLELVLDQEVGLEVLQSATKPHCRVVTKILKSYQILTNNSNKDKMVIEALSLTSKKQAYKQITK